MIREPVKNPRAVVSVAMSSEEFSRVAEAAREQGMHTSAFIREAALKAAQPPAVDPNTVRISGPVYSRYPRQSQPGPPIRVWLSEHPS